MDKVIQFLTENPTFYLATVDGNVPKVRPFGFVMNYNNKMYFCTGNQKNVYKQLKANPQFEVSTTSKTGEWLRLSGKAVFDTNKETKQAALNSAPFLSTLYGADDPKFEVFYIENAEAKFYNRQGISETINF